MPSPEMLARMPIPPEMMAHIPPDILARMQILPAGPQAPGDVLGGPFTQNGIPQSVVGPHLPADPKKSAEYEKRQVAIRLLQTGMLMPRKISYETM
jgi:hypothetical protein